MSETQLWETTMNPETRHSVKLILKTQQKLTEYFQCLWEMKYHQEENLLRRMRPTANIDT